jgi:peptide/nickel transport system permease protein
MLTYIIRRLLLVPVLLFGVTLVIFGMLQFLTPVERASLYIKQIPKNPGQIAGTIRRYHLDDPLPVQYWNWLVGIKDTDTDGNPIIRGGVLRGDLGWSRVGSQAVVDVLKERFPATAELALWAFFPIIGVGVWLGIQAAINHNNIFDQFARVFSIVGYSFPIFVFGLLTLMIFYAKLHWFMPGRVSDWVSAEIIAGTFPIHTKLVTLDALLNGRFDVFLDTLRHLVLPVLTLSYVSWAQFLRITRSSMLESMGQDYMITAKAKGVSRRDQINKHALPNALIPVATIAGFTIIGLLGGVVITETIFTYPGIGSMAALAAANLDIVTVLGFALFNGTILIIANLVTDILYAVLDPRVRLS